MTFFYLKTIYFFQLLFGLFFPFSIWIFFIRSFTFLILFGLLFFTSLFGILFSPSLFGLLFPFFFNSFQSSFLFKLFFLVFLFISLFILSRSDFGFLPKKNSWQERSPKKLHYVIYECPWRRCDFHMINPLSTKGIRLSKSWTQPGAQSRKQLLGATAYSRLWNGRKPERLDASFYSFLFSSS